MPAGDLSTNLAMVLAKAQRTIRSWQNASYRARIPRRSRVIAGAGFINFWLAQDALGNLLQTIIAAGPVMDGTASARPAVNVEFVSANPTGPLHVDNGRGATIGDAIATCSNGRAMRSPASSTSMTLASRSNG
jgi:arginyl-tRNA synthetase